jgi:hypothetical protein
MSEDSRERKLLGREEEEGGGRGSWRQLTSFSSWKIPATDKQKIFSKRNSNLIL